MSPRSEEFFASAQRRLRSARAQLDLDAPEIAVSLAYYAMLYAARAALSEGDHHAKTHAGTWDLFWRTLVAPGDFDEELAADARKLQRPREAADYDAAAFEDAFAAAAVATAERFVAAVRELVGA